MCLVGEGVTLREWRDGIVVDEPVGEILLNPVGPSIGYCVRADHRGRGLARKAAAMMTRFVHERLGSERVLMEIEDDNAPSIAIAHGLGFRRTDDPPISVPDKGRPFILRTWAHQA